MIAPLRRIDAHIVEEDVRGADQPGERGATLRRLEVEREHPLVAVVVDEQGAAAGTGRMGVARDVALERLDLDHLGAKVGEDLAGIGAEHDRADLDDPDPLQQRQHVSLPW